LSELTSAVFKLVAALPSKVASDGAHEVAQSLLALLRLIGGLSGGNSLGMVRRFAAPARAPLRLLFAASPALREDASRLLGAAL